MISRKNKKNIILIKLFFLSCLLIFSFSLALSVSAQSLVPCGLNGTANCTLCHLVIGFKNIYDYLLKIVLLPATGLVIVVAGVMYMVSSGSKGMIDKAKSALVYALTAAILALTAWLIINATLSALGYKKAGSWSTFTCDTTQSTGPGTGTNGNTLPGNTAGSQVPGAGGTGCQAVAGNASSMIGMGYSQENRNGANTADCSSVAERSYAAAGCKSPGSGSGGIYANAKPLDPGSLKAGDLIVYRKETGGASNHVATCLNDGCGDVIGANSARGIYEKGSTYDLGQAGAKMISASDYCSGDGC